MFYGSYPVYCDGILSFPPFNIYYSKQYHNIHLSNKHITYECPYFMTKMEQLRLTTSITNTANGITLINRGLHYHTITGTLLGTYKGNSVRSNYYTGYFTTFYKTDITPDAPLTEYVYEGLYIYIIGSTVGTLTKPALPETREY
jgi:hypothetical protein